VLHCQLLTIGSEWLLLRTPLVSGDLTDGSHVRAAMQEIFSVANYAQGWWSVFVITSVFVIIFCLNKYVFFFSENCVFFLFG
jgi:hypothetical protein